MDGANQEIKMKSNTVKRVLGTLALAGVSIPALAADPPGWYIGGNLGESRAEIAEEQITADLLTSGYTTTDFRQDDQDIGYKLFAGYQLSQYFALEAGYLNLGEFNYTANTIPEGSKRAELEFKGWNLDVIGMLPVSENSNLFLRYGRHRSESQVEFASTGGVSLLNPRVSKRTTNYKVGLGYQHGISDNLDMRFEVERYRMVDAVSSEKGDLDLVSVGLVYHFGRTASSASSSSAPAPVPSETLIVAPLPAATAEYCSLLNIQFEVAQDEIQLKEQERLAVLATFLQRYPETTAVIEGHSDNVGAAQTNRQLSQRRAQSVVDYLVSEHQIAHPRLVALGLGETRPIADNRTEEGKRENRRIAAIIGCATDIAGLETLPARMTLAMHIEFDTNSANIGPEYRNQLGRVARFLKENPEIMATMEGHSDNASPDMAQRISQQRAESVASYLVEEFDITRSRLKVQGFGETRRFAYNTSTEGRQQNRRVNIILDYPH